MELEFSLQSLTGRSPQSLIYFNMAESDFDLCCQSSATASPASTCPLRVQMASNQPGVPGAVTPRLFCLVPTSSKSVCMISQWWFCGTPRCTAARGSHPHVTCTARASLWGTLSWQRQHEWSQILGWPHFACTKYSNVYENAQSQFYIHIKPSAVWSIQHSEIYCD